MQVFEAIEKRASIRDYQETAVPDDKLNRVLEAARLAPTGGNRQEVKFVVVRNKELRAKLAEATGNQKHVGQAPVLIAAVSTGPERMMLCGVPAYPVDAAIAVDHITLAAVEEGLGTCWIGAFRQEMVRSALGIPDKYMVAALLTLGYPRGGGNPKTRKPLNERVCFDKFNE